VVFATVELRVVAECAIDAPLDRRIRALLCACFPAAHAVFSVTRAWHGSAPAWTVLAERTGGDVVGPLGALVGHVGVVERSIRIAGQPFRVGGVQNVAVCAAQRGQGLARRLMQRVRALLRSEQYGAGLLFCTDDLVAVYERCGWELLDATRFRRITAENPVAPLPAGSRAMWQPAGATRWPPGEVHLQGGDW
jgi:GNAT superfamily N-acetyltransferase